MRGHWFWAPMTAAVMLWYTTITIDVAIKGWQDIKNMLRDLGRDHKARQVRS
jgi:hypothetical protein